MKQHPFIISQFCRLAVLISWPGFSAQSPQAKIKMSAELGFYVEVGEEMGRQGVESPFKLIQVIGKSHFSAVVGLSIL